MRIRSSVPVSLVLAVLPFAGFPLAAAPAPPQRPAAPPAESLSDLFHGMRYRCIGPFRGGRVTTVAGVRGRPATFFQGATGGGVFRTTDSGAHWEPLGEKDFRTGSVGAIAVAESDPNVIWVGMGEAPIRGNVSHGDGVYRSVDAGRSFRNVGLEETRQIARIVVHPKDPDVAYVAAQGHVWGPNPERGIFRTTDGGKSWQKVLYVDERTGASDVAMDPGNPRVLFAGLWQVERKPWTLVSGGPGSGLYRSTDAGETWKKLTEGLPEGTWGKVGVSVSGAKAGRVFAMVEAEKGGVFRSEDLGETWKKVNDENKLRQRAWYYTEIFADPGSADVVYVANVRLHRSADGGKTFEALPEPHGDNHDLWIDPDEPSRMVKGDDGGAAVSLDTGQTWSTLYNQPTAQLYRVAVDDRWPYFAYGAQQDNSTVAVPSRVRGGEIERTDWYPVGGCESGWIAPKPKDPDVVFAGCYGGSISRYDRRTGEEREVVAWPQLAVGQAARDLKYRFQWNAPILVSRHDGALYHAAQVLLRSTDEGTTWTETSPDLSKNDRSKQETSGGPITRDNTGVEVYGTIFALAEVPQEPGAIWAGTDDGLVHVTRDNGKSWANVTPKGMPEWIQVNSIEASPHAAGTAYVAATMYKHDDLRPYLFKTADWGKSWTRIDAVIPAGAFTRVVREDPERKGLLFAGTETGVWLSFDDGATWAPFQRNLPVVPVTDLALAAGDLVVATQGRSVWILADLSPLRQWSPAIQKEAAHLFSPRPAVRFPSFQPDEPTSGPVPPPRSGKNGPGGLVVDLWLKETPAKTDKVVLEVLQDGKLLRAFTNEKKEKSETADAVPDDEDEPKEKPLELKKGLNRFVWDLRMLRPNLVPKAVVWGSKEGPRVAPGTYGLRLSGAGTTKLVTAEVRPNPNVKVAPEELQRQAVLLRDLRDRIAETHGAVRRIRDVKAQAAAAARRAGKLGKGTALAEKQKALAGKLTAIEEQLVNPKLKAIQDVLNFPPALDHQLIGLAGAVSSADAAPTPASVAYSAELKARLDALKASLATLLETEVPAFNKAAAEAGIAPVTPLPEG